MQVFFLGVLNTASWTHNDNFSRGGAWFCSMFTGERSAWNWFLAEGGGDTVKIWKNLLWIISLIAFGLKSNWRLELPLKCGFSILGYFFLGGGLRRFWSKIGGKVTTQMDLTPEKCHLMGIYWINVPPEVSCFCFSHFSRSPEEKPTEIRIHFLGVGLSNPLRIFKAGSAKAGRQRGGGGWGFKQCQSHDPPLLLQSSSPVCLFHFFRWHYFTTTSFPGFSHMLPHMTSRQVHLAWWVCGSCVSQAFTF